ncbi:MAG TPA: hypothetical protein PKC99_01810 [Anaerolineales bacterium]|jgi:hypothetical protein|nr:hypothetical protein [Chloroflexota bacterium]WKZ55508.1 MAG: hypothetical protein QY324_05635 [Anaerolineales bacterium]GJQ37406.1 MAG: hypothetical protein JETCAE01_34160 [Anaerolineaceae bacterium]NOG74325.1 hypothetical protein [Chloroflexota bacterium]GIK09044.1 MAG: hypothetical protein BroJett001_11100 [Chloroflexota bacterium]
MPFYLGRRSEDDLILFHSTAIPNKHTHGHLYKAVIGPFVSRVGAGYFARYGRNNPNIRTAADAERLARADPLMEQLIVEESMTTEELTIALECDAQDQAEYSPNPTLPVASRQEFFQTQGAIPCLIGLKTN